MKHRCEDGPNNTPCGKTDECRLCYLYAHDAKYNLAWGGDGNVSPGIWQMAANFAKAVVGHVADGMKHVSNEEKQRRLSICRANTCGKYKDNSCLHKNCGCNLEVKAGWASEQCPIGMWEVKNDGPLACSSATEGMSVESMIEFIRYCPPGPWPKDWAKWANTTEAHTRLLGEAVAALPSYPGGFAGRGIIIGGGGRKYFTCAWVCINMLRHLDCQLPIQLWYLGKQELDPIMEEMMHALGVECINAREVEKQHQVRILAGWELKAFAVQHCRFEEVLYLDADNVPVLDPEYLFDEDLYREKGAIFWPDLPPYDRREWVPRAVWDHCGMTYQPQVRAFESGQFLINKEKCWPELCLTMWINEHSDYYYGNANVGVGMVYGDKDTFLIGWHKVAEHLSRPWNYVMPSKPPGWSANGKAGAILQYDLRGRLLFQHRCQPNAEKWDNSDRIPGFIYEDQCFGFLADLRSRWGGALWHNYAPSKEEQEYAASCVGLWRYKRLIDTSDRILEFLPGSVAGGRIGRGGADYERRWEVFFIDGKPYIAICHEDRLTCLLSKYGTVWRGAWQEHEKSEVELERAS